MTAGDVRLTLVSRLAFYPVHWRAFGELCTRYQVRGSVIAEQQAELPAVHRQARWIEAGEAAAERFRPDIRLLPEAPLQDQLAWLERQLDELAPDAVWVQAEPTDSLLLRSLRKYLLRRRPRIVAAVCENEFPRPPTLLGFKRRLLWSRLDGLLAVATPSLEGVRQVGMPTRVPAATLVAGVEEPPEAVEPLALPLADSSDRFVCGFVGRIVEEKGWRVAVEAARRLPPEFAFVFAGDGAEVSRLEASLAEPELRGRTAYLGLLGRPELWRLYAALDCLVLPSLTRPWWKEQFGAVLAEAMAASLPVVGSDSGAIPEVVGPAGLIVEEGEPDRLADALHRLRDEPELRRQLGDAGRRRHLAEFSIPAYADKIATVLGLLPRTPQ